MVIWFINRERLFWIGVGRTGFSFHGVPNAGGGFSQICLWPKSLTYRFLCRESKILMSYNYCENFITNFLI